MPTFQALSLMVLFDVVSAGGTGSKSHSGCQGDISDGPLEADVEVRLGNLPPSTADQPVYLSWWAARRSAKVYSPLRDPSEAEVHSDSFRAAYAEQNTPDFNGGKVLVNEAGEATLRVQAPAVYHGHRYHSGKRDPHVHFQICGHHGRPKKVVFTREGARISGGCQKHGQSGIVSYKIISAKEINWTIGTMANRALPQDDIAPMGVTEKEDRSEAKNWDALEFSSVYECLDEVKPFDQFSSACATQCPSHAEIAHGQCVRKKGSQDMKAELKATWHLQLDCNSKCWKDAAPVARHNVRLALADHLDITFQECVKVQFRKDGEYPSTHAHLQVFVKTGRLAASMGAALLGSFLANSTVASDFLGLTVHDVHQVSSDKDRDKTDITAKLEQTNSNVTGADGALPGEDSDQYAEYYEPLEKDAERQAKSQPQGNDHSIAGIAVPDAIPVIAIIGVAAGIVLVIAGLAVLFYCRRRRLAAQRASSASDSKTAEANVVAIPEKAAV